MERGEFIKQLAEWGILRDYAFDRPLLCSVCGVIVDEDSKFYWFFDARDNSIAVLHKRCLDVSKTRLVPCSACGWLRPMDSEEGCPCLYGKVFCFFCLDRVFAEEVLDETD